MIEITKITKTYRKGDDVFTALENVSFEITKGDFISVFGPSGSGKSTLLNTIGGLIHPDSGDVLYNGKSLYNDGIDLDLFRKKEIGFMFQQFHLMPYLTIYDNIRLACYERKQIEKTDHFLDKTSLTLLKYKYPSELSVGEKQRTAFIRAIITNPALLLADEPTGNLDQGNTGILLSLISEYQQNGGTVVVVTHDPLVTKYANRKIELNKGKVIAN